MFRKTYIHQLSAAAIRPLGAGAYIVTAEDANDLAAPVELHKQPLVEVLQSCVSFVLKKMDGG
jgi:hypothetical protein